MFQTRMPEKLQAMLRARCHTPCTLLIKVREEMDVKEETKTRNRGYTQNATQGDAKTWENGNAKNRDAFETPSTRQLQNATHAS